MDNVCNHVRFYNQEMIRHLFGEKLQPPESWRPAVEVVRDFKECSLSPFSEILDNLDILFSEKPDALETKQIQENVRRMCMMILLDVSCIVKFKDIVSEELITAIHLLLSLYYFNPFLVDDDTVKNFLKTIRDKDLKLD